MTNLRNPAVRIQKARTALLLDHPFFGSLLFRLGGRSSTSIETMATDGVSLYYNPSYVETLNASELAGVLAHEVMHPALQHHTRRGGRNPKRWNMACDYAINPLLIDAGLTLPKDVLIEHRFRGMSAKRIYNLIEEQGTEPSQETVPADHAPKGDSSDQQASSKDGGGQVDAPVTPGGIGRKVLDAAEPDGDEGASVAERQGNGRLPLSRLKPRKTCREAARRCSSQSPRIRCRGGRLGELLRRAWSDTIPSDYSWISQTGAMFGQGCSARCHLRRCRRDCHRCRLLRIRQSSAAGAFSGGGSLDSRSAATESGARALLRYRSPQGRNLSGRADDQSDSDRRRGYQLRTLLCMVE